MPSFSEKSDRILKTCDHRLQQLFLEVEKYFDCTVLEGQRGAVKQMEYYNSTPRKTKLVWPLSKHNGYPNLKDVASILRCEPTIKSISKAIVGASTEALIAIDELPVLSKSMAVDVVPYPVDWRYVQELYQAIDHGQDSIAKDVLANIERWFKFGGYVTGIAQKMGIEVTWGGDWNGDNQMSDERFRDLPHFQLEI